jgi:hypothetical protein
MVGEKEKRSHRQTAYTRATLHLSQNHVVTSLGSLRAHVCLPNRQHHLIFSYQTFELFVSSMRSVFSSQPALSHLLQMSPLSNTIFQVHISPNISHSQAPFHSSSLTRSDRHLSHPQPFIPYSSTSSSSTSVYADINGNLHDPDYCPFPTVAAPHFPTWESGSNDNEVDMH